MRAVVLLVPFLAVSSAVDMADLIAGAATTFTNSLTNGLSNILTITAGLPISQCPRLQESDLKLLLFTRKTTNGPVRINPRKPIPLNPNKKLILIMHGWLSDSYSFGFPRLRDEYLKRYDSNVIMVDWSVSSWQTYRIAVCYLEQIARLLAKFLCRLQREQKLPVSSVHLVGHSLGAQMSASISQRTMKMCKSKVHRITAMDPAKPYYQDLPKNQRLDKDDAHFVDVIHTNEGVLGYYGDCGHIDFYVNCGRQQPGCPSISIADLIDHPLPTVSCEHFRSVEFMAESINSDGFKALPCPSCPSRCQAHFQSSSEVTMGEDCPRNATGPYVLYTRSASPFAMGSMLPNNNRLRRVARH